jgi:hypothetical protein
MSSFTLFGIDERGIVLGAERVGAESVDAAREIARERLSRFPSVEVWEVSVCVARLRRPRGKGDGPTVTAVGAAADRDEAARAKREAAVWISRLSVRRISGPILKRFWTWRSHPANREAYDALSAPEAREELDRQLRLAGLHNRLPPSRDAHDAARTRRPHA